MTRYTLVVTVDSDDDPREVVNEIVSTLEFEHRSTVHSVVVLNENGNVLTIHDPKEKTQ